MSTCGSFQSQLASIMEELLKAAVEEISKLVDDKCSVLHLEISRRTGENEALRRRLRTLENPENPYGSYTAASCVQAAGGVKFTEVDTATVSFTIKEESPDEMLWISETSGPHGSGVQYQNAPDGDCQLNSGVSRKPADFGDLYNSSSSGGLQFTVKTEKDDDQPPFGHDGCQRGAAAKPLTADFSVDERENQLWTSIIEGEDIDAGFPDFSSVVDAYSFPENSDSVSNAPKPAGVQPLASQRLCNGVYGGGEYPKDAAQSSGFQARPQGSAQPEQVYVQTRNQTNVPHPDNGDRETATGDRPGGGAYTGGGYHTQKSYSGVARSYSCTACGKTFGRMHQFKLHQQSHKRKRAFWCSVCGKSFQCSSHLSIHHRTHTGEKPYGCGQCGKRFTQQSSLRVHQRTHSGERPYGCSLCGKTFILMHHLKRHRIIHTYSGGAANAVAGVTAATPEGNNTAVELLR